MAEPTKVGETLGAYLTTLAANVRRAEDRHQELDPAHLSPAEIRLAEALTRAGLDPVQQYRIGQFNADFCFVDEHLVIEVDGAQWHIADRDRRRDELLRQRGWRTLRIPASHVRADADRVAQLIKTVLDEIQIKAGR